MDINYGWLVLADKCCLYWAITYLSDTETGVKIFNIHFLWLSLLETTVERKEKLKKNKKENKKWFLDGSMAVRSEWKASRNGLEKCGFVSIRLYIQICDLLG